MKDFKRNNNFGAKKSFGDRPSGGQRFNDRPRFGGKPSFGERPKFGRDQRNDDRPSFPATCDGCHKQCTVPFRPSGDKPVFCDACFQNNRGNEGFTPSFDRGRDTKRSFTQEKSFAPAHDNGGDMKKQFDILASKMDTIINLLQKQHSTVSPQNTEKVAAAPLVKTEEAMVPKKASVAKKEMVEEKKATKKAAPKTTAAKKAAAAPAKSVKKVAKK